ncbi:hypothetical protein AGMMS49957_02280 [Synergistales bacterium]|nr:hypothetical protein AGMMS49957_02280 [Synergistales bacterium]
MLDKLRQLIRDGESKIFPYATDSKLLLERLMPQVRQLALSRNEKHPWAKSSDREIMQSAGLYQTDHITGQSFTPQPKNPLLANFFINLGYADALGSGVRNLYKYTKIYSGGEPELVECDVFRTIVPLILSLTEVSDNGHVSDNVSDKLSDNDFVSDKRPVDVLIAYLKGNGEITATDAAKIIKRSSATARRLLSRLVDEGVVVASGGNRNRKYRVLK